VTGGRTKKKSRRRPLVTSLSHRATAMLPRRSASPLITLLTDFGTADYFVAAVKGVILAISPRANIVDITHDIPPQDIEAAAFTLLAAHSSFPAGAIHISVVDPTVGSSRRAILIEACEQFFVGPDNGVFSYVCERQGVARVFHLNKEKYFRHPVSATFNGRDIFAPVAAALSVGIKPERLGTEIADYVRLPALKAEISQGGRLKARIIHIDRFGNCVTNITPLDLTNGMTSSGLRLSVKGKPVKAFKNFFAEETKDREKVFGIWGSAGFLEIAAINESAAKLLNARRGDSVIVIGA
jgi:S-adenosyl-L-methionine hydrolase (adenosine-forming)